MRVFAVRLLGQIGSERDTPPIVALLSDKDPTISCNAATTLQAIGNHRTLTALDVWLNSGNHQDNEVLRKHVAKCRDELKQRLEKEKRARN